MFWRVSGFAQPSPVEAALDRGNCTLEDLLAEDDLIQVRWASVTAAVSRTLLRGRVDGGCRTMSRQSSGSASWRQ